MSSNTTPILLKMRRRPRYSARPFALTILAISLISLLAWAKRGYAHSEEPPTRGGIVKRDVLQADLEVRDPLSSSVCLSLLTHRAVQTSPPSTRSMRVCLSQLPRRRSWHILLPVAVLLSTCARKAHRLHFPGTMARPSIQYNRYRSKRLLLRQSEHHLKSTWNE